MRTGTSSLLQPHCNKLIAVLTRIPFGDKIGYQYAWLTFALLNVIFLVPMIMLRFYGIRWRNSSWQKPPTFHNDI